MPEQSIIVWDLESIPDLPAAARMLDMSNAAEADGAALSSGSAPSRRLSPSGKFFSVSVGCSGTGAA
jgi:hypothetical protein